MGVVDKSWQKCALALDKTGVMSRRGIAKALGISKTTCLDFLKSVQTDNPKTREWVSLPGGDFTVTDYSGVMYTLWRNAGGSSRYRMYWRSPVGAIACVGVSESDVRSKIASGLWSVG